MIPAPPVNIAVLGPPLALFVAAVLVLFLDVLPPRRDKTHLAVVALAGVIGALLLTLMQWGHDERGFRDMVVLDNYALFIDASPLSSRCLNKPASTERESDLSSSERNTTMRSLADAISIMPAVENRTSA